MSIFVNKELRDLIPPLSEEEFEQLEKNVVAEGIRDPLVVWKQPNGNDMLIDGHNRFFISAHHAGIPFKTVSMEFANMDEAKRWIILNQFGRRNLSAYDRSVLALKLKPIIAEKAKENQANHTEQGYQKSDKPVTTSKELAKVAGVSHDTIHKVETIQNSGDKELIRQVRGGETTINRAYQAVKGIDPIKTKTPAQMHKERIDKAREEHEQFQQQKVIGFSDISKDKENRRALAKETYKKLLSIGSKIEEISIQSEAGDIDLKAVGKELSHEEKKMLLDMIGVWRQQLTKIGKEVTGN
jgi:hypothetical protein